MQSAFAAYSRSLWRLVTTLLAAVEAAASRAVRRHIKAVVTQPHHYYTAAGISLTLWAIGHSSTEAHALAWLYAFMETLISGGD